MQNYPVGYPTYSQTQTVTTPAAQPQNASGATFNIGVPQGVPQAPNATNLNGANGVTINIIGAGVYPNGANVNNTFNSPAQPGQAYDPNYYLKNLTGQQQQTPSVPIASTPLNQPQNDAKTTAKKDIVLLTDEYIQTLENYIRNDNPEIKIMGAKKLMERFREDESRKNDPALTALLNLVLQSKYSQVKIIGTTILENGWAKGDAITQQLLSQIQQSKSGYGIDALDAASAALRSAEQTIKVDDPNPPKPKTLQKAA